MFRCLMKHLTTRACFKYVYSGMLFLRLNLIKIPKIGMETEYENICFNFIDPFICICMQQ
jgi:hypothetical protein